MGTCDMTKHEIRLCNNAHGLHSFDYFPKHSVKVIDKIVMPFGSQWG